MHRGFVPRVGVQIDDDDEIVVGRALPVGQDVRGVGIDERQVVQALQGRVVAP